MTDHFRDNEDSNRFDLNVDDTIAFVTYRKSPGVITLVHTEVPPKLGGRGMARNLVARPSMLCGLKDGNSRSNAISSDPL